MTPCLCDSTGLWNHPEAGVCEGYITAGLIAAELWANRLGGRI